MRLSRVSGPGDQQGRKAKASIGPQKVNRTYKWNMYSQGSEVPCWGHPQHQSAMGLIGELRWGIKIGKLIGEWGIKIPHVVSCNTDFFFFKTVSLIAVFSISMVPKAHPGAPQAKYSTSRRKPNGKNVCGHCRGAGGMNGAGMRSPPTGEC